MTDHDAATDPVDKAYVEAEALLGDDPARAARRARVLAAVGREAAMPAAEVPSRRPSPWRRGGWLAAAGVAVFCAFLAGRIYQPAPDRPPPAAAMTSALTAPVTPSDSASPATAAKSPALAPALRRPASEVHPAEWSAGRVRAEPAPEAVPAPPPAPPPPPPPAPFAASADAPAASRRMALSSSALNEVVVTGSRIARQDFKAAASAPALALATRPSAPPISPDLANRGARLRAAAAHGRTAELDSLLAGGLPVDIPDAGGTTALMKAIQADQPSAAALLLRHGASLDQRNGAGVSARDMAIQKDDPELNQAIGSGADVASPAPPRLGSQ